MSPGTVLAVSLGAMVLLVAIVLLVMVRRFRRRPEVVARRALRAAKIVTVAEAREGRRVAIRGRVRSLDGIVQAPLSGQPAVAYAVRVEATQRFHDSQGGQSSQRVQLFNETEGTDFEVLGDDGGARVVTRGATFAFSITDEYGFGQIEDLGTNQRLGAYLRTYSLGEPEDPGFAEATLREGDTVVVSGVAQWERVPGRAGTGYRSEGRRLRLEAAVDEPLYVGVEPMDPLLVFDFG